MRITSTEARIFLMLLEDLDLRSWECSSIRAWDYSRYFDKIAEKLKLGSVDGRQFAPGVRKNSTELLEVIKREMLKEGIIEYSTKTGYHSKKLKSGPSS